MYAKQGLGSHLSLLLVLCLMAGTRGSHAQIAPPLTTLHNFNNSDGANPTAPLIESRDGNFYGTTQYGGVYGVYGTVFKITTNGQLTTLYRFTGGSDGSYPYCSMQGKDGNLYGTTLEGGANGCGTVFLITTSGALTTIHNFTGTDGAESHGVIQGRDGNIYGTTYSDGANGYGTVFKLTMKPVITSFSPTSGPVGTVITFTGVNFTEATAVMFGKVAVPFTINSDTSLTFTVPTGAVTAAIKVVNPFGTGTSKQRFFVTP